MKAQDIHGNTLEIGKQFSAKPIRPEKKYKIIDGKKAISILISCSRDSEFILPISSTISRALKDDLVNRFKKIKFDIGEACVADRNFDGLNLSNDDINDMLEHIFSNYGEAIIEKSNIKSELKEQYIDAFLNNGSGFNEFMKIEEL